jgi:septum formation protein
MAGVAFDADTAPVDEAGMKEAYRQDGASAADTAIAIGEMKALRVSQRRPGRLVVGADQMLDLDGHWFNKPANRAEARDHLMKLRGRAHRLTSAVVVVQDGQRVWHHVSTAIMTMRPFTDHFLDDYINREGDKLLSSVGAYRLEGLGVQLFHAIDGDYFTILGLPLLPLLDFLRDRRELAQ